MVSVPFSPHQLKKHISIVPPSTKLSRSRHVNHIIISAPILLSRLLSLINDICFGRKKKIRKNNNIFNSFLGVSFSIHAKRYFASFQDYCKLSFFGAFDVYCIAILGIVLSTFFFVLKMSSAYYVSCKYSKALQTTSSRLIWVHIV